MSSFFEELSRPRLDPVGGTPTPSGLADTFGAGVKSTVDRFSADIDYFKALGNVAIGNQEAAAKNIQSAQFNEEIAAIPVAGLETFKEFIDEPTVEGFLSQVSLAGGQLLPYAVSSIVGAGVGGVAAAAGRGVLNHTNRAVAKRLIRDATERALAGKASLDESVVAANAYRLFKEQQRGEIVQSATRGALVGAGASEYVPLAAGNLSEALESGEELDRGTAFRAAGLALPQAAIGVGGEALIAKSLFNVAKRRAPKVKSVDNDGNTIDAIDESTFVGRFASDIGKSYLRAGTVEGTTEVLQEGISVANRFDLDDEYTTQDAQLRLAQAAFMGFFGGGMLGGAGGAVASGARETGYFIERQQDSFRESIKDLPIPEYAEAVRSLSDFDLAKRIRSIGDSEIAAMAREQGNRIVASAQSLTDTELANKVRALPDSELATRVRNIADSELVSKFKRQGSRIRDAAGQIAGSDQIQQIFNKTKDFVDRGRELTIDRIFNKEQYGQSDTGLTTQEPQSDIDAQFAALTDDSSTKKAVWIAGNTPQQGATKDGKMQSTTVNGFAASTAFVPGKGTIITLEENKDIVEAVITSDASEESLKEALGYSSVKDLNAINQVVVQALDKDGNVVSEELTSTPIDPQFPERNPAVVAADGLAPEGGQVRIRTLEDALETRKQKVADEQNIADMAMEDDTESADVAMARSEVEQAQEVYDAIERLDLPDQTKQLAAELVSQKQAAYEEALASQTEAGSFEEMGNIVNAREQQLDMQEEVLDQTEEGFEFNEAIAEQDVSEEVISDYAPRKSIEEFELQEGEQELRDQFILQFRDSASDIPTDFENSEARFYSGALLKRAVAESGNNAGSVAIQRNEEGRFELIRLAPTDEQLYTFQNQDGTQTRVNLAKFLDLAVSKATKKSRYTRASQVTITTPAGKELKVNLVDLTRSGKRVREVSTGSFEGTGPFRSALEGFQAISAELLVSGYEISFNGVPITDLSDLRGVDMIAANINNKDITVSQLIRASEEGGTSLYERNQDGSIKRYVESDPEVREDPSLLGQPIISSSLPKTKGATIPPEERSGDEIRTRRVVGATDAEGNPIAATIEVDDEGEMTRMAENPFGVTDGVVTRLDTEGAESPTLTRGPASPAFIAPEATAPAPEATTPETLQEEYDSTQQAEYKAEAETTKRGKIVTGRLNDSRVRKELAGSIVLFGDNLLRRGKGGQAVIRDAPNAFGIPTKRSPGRREQDYFSDKPDEIAAVKEALDRLTRDYSESFLLPEDGIGTGLAQLRERSPQIAALLHSFFQQNVEGYNNSLAPAPEAVPEAVPETTALAPETIVDDTYEDVINQQPTEEQLHREAVEAGLVIKGGVVTVPDDYGIKDPEVVAYIKDLLGDTGLNESPIILSSGLAQELLNRGLFEEYITGVPSIVKSVEDFLTGGRQKSLGMAGQVLNNAKTVIIVRDGLDTEGAAITSTHEIGHALFYELKNSLLENPAIRKRLENAFKNHPRYQFYMDLGKGDFSKAFNEFFADQFTKRAIKQHLKPKNGVDSVFKTLAKQMRDYWRTAKRMFEKRFDTPLDEDFETFLNAVISSKKTGEAVSPDLWVEKKLAQDVNEATRKQMGPELEGTINFLEQLRDRVLDGREIRPIYNIFLSADSYLRRIAGNKIADLFYVRAQQGRAARDQSATSVLGMVPARREQRERLENMFISMVGSPSDPAVVQALIDAQNDVSTETLRGTNPLAARVRDFYKEVYDSYIAPSNSNIQFQENYTPVVLNLEAISLNPDAFIDLVLRESGQLNDPNARERVTAAVVELVQQNDPVIGKDLSKSLWRLNPQQGVEQARELTANIDPQKLTEFLRPPEESLIEYINAITKRVEWNRHTKDARGVDILGPMIEKLTPENREKAQQIIETYLGYQKAPMNPFWRSVNSWAQVVQFYTILPFVTLASLTELAGPMIASKDFAALAQGLKTIAATFKDYKQAEIFARDIGVISSETVATVFLTESERQFMTDKARDASDAFFKYTGLNAFTRFTRVFASNMAINFVIRHSDPATMTDNSRRYLDELGLTPETVRTWVDNRRDMGTPEGRKVEAGISRFVESSILRPNAAERPIWASDPRFALIWQLKGFFWSYGKVIMAGIAREARTRLNKGDTVAAGYTSTATILALAAVATLPLAMLGLELREYAKNGLAWLLPGVEPSNKYFRSDRMDWPEYMGEIVDRSGMYGPFTILIMMQQASEWGRSPISPALGPTAETIETIVRNGFDIGKTLEQRLIPIRNQL